jgi:four helix bundle protein
VWNDAIALYVLSCRVFKNWPYELRRVAGQQTASVDSVHRNIAEGYCRRSINEYLQHLYIALGSLGESVSGIEAYRAAGQILQTDFDQINALAFKLENGMLRLVEALERKRERGDWIDHLVVKETNEIYSAETKSPLFQCSNAPSLRCSVTSTPHLSASPPLHHSNTPSPQEACP